MDKDNLSLKAALAFFYYMFFERLTDGNIEFAKPSEKPKDGDSYTAAGSANTSFRYSANLQWIM